MFIINRLMEILTFGRMIPKWSLIQKIMIEMAASVLLAVISAILTGSLIIGGLYALYLVFLFYGLSPQAALITTASLTLLITAAFIYTTSVYLRRLLETSRRFLRTPQSPIAKRIGNATNAINDVADAFVDGLLTSPGKPGKHS